MPSRIVSDSLLRDPDLAKLDGDPLAFLLLLIYTVEDFGLFEADPVLLRADVYPRKVDAVSVEEVERRLQACAAAGAVELYEVDGVRYGKLRIIHWTPRARNPKFPLPPSSNQTSVNNREQTHADVNTGAQAKADAHTRIPVRTNAPYSYSYSNSNSLTPPKPPKGGRGGKRKEVTEASLAAKHELPLALVVHLVQEAAVEKGVRDPLAIVAARLEQGTGVLPDRPAVSTLERWLRLRVIATLGGKEVTYPAHYSHASGREGVHFCPAQQTQKAADVPAKSITWESIELWEGRE